MRSLFSETPEGTTQLKEEPSSPVQGTQVQEPAEQEKKEDRNMACGQPANEEDSLVEGILDEGGHLTPIDDLAS